MPYKILKQLEHYIRVGKADLHIHSNYSDGKPSIEEILDYVEDSTDLDVIAITDHDTIEGALYAKALHRNKEYRFDLIIGEEVSAIEGHVLAINIREAIPAKLPVNEVLRRVKEQGGIAIAAHPFYHTKLINTHMVVMNGIGTKSLFKNHHNLDGIEIVNATPTLADENLAAAVMNRAMLFRAETGSSDAHILAAIGRAYTAFEGKTSEDLIRSIKKHQCQAIYTGWTFLSLIKYLWFFIPIGFRLLWFNIFKTHEDADSLIKTLSEESTKAEAE